MSHILVVDDSDIVRNMICALLVDHGYAVLSAASAQEAYRSVQKFPPDLILLDVQLPDVKGHELCRYLRSQASTRHIPIIMVTGAARQVDEKVRGFQYGADDYILKPFDPPEFLERVRAVLRRAPRCISEQKKAESVPAAPAPVAAPRPSYPGMTLTILAGMIFLLYTGTLLAPGVSMKPFMVCLTAAAFWGLLVSALVVACSLAAISLQWKEGARLFAMAVSPLLLKYSGACVFSGWTTLPPFLFSAGPALFVKSPAPIIYRLDLFELWAVIQLGILLRKRPGATLIKTVVLTMVVWGAAVILLTGLQQWGSGS